jgi:hypothetical protein
MRSDDLIQSGERDSACIEHQLDHMLDFYRDYEAKPKLQSLIGEISWTKNLLIMARCKDDLEREFYEFQNPKKKKPRLQSPPQRAGEGVPRLTGRFYDNAVLGRRGCWGGYEC